MRASLFAHLPQRLHGNLLTAGFFSILLSLSACYNTRLYTGLQPVSRTADTTGNSQMSLFRASAPRIWEIVNTTLTLRFDFEKKEARGEEWLQVMPYARATDTLVLDAKSMEIQSVAEKDLFNATLNPLPYTYDGAQLKIVLRGLHFGNLDSRLAQTLRIEYTARPYAKPVGGSAAIGEDRGLYFINTDHKIPGKPVQIWTQGETESNSHWMPTLDKPNQRSTFKISLIVPDSMQTLSNGTLRVSTPQSPGLRMDTWEILRPIQVYAAMFAIGRFDITHDTWRNEQGQSLDVDYYVEPAFAPYARGMFRNTPEMLSFFSQYTGVSYPWTKYSQVVVRDYVSGAMENTSASLFGEFTNKNARQLIDESNEDVVSHELFHQWFGDYVTCESWSHINLNESFASYGELLWRRYKYGAAEAEEHAWGDLMSYLDAAKKSDPPLVRYHYRSREDVFDRISYQKGACILRYMGSILGDTLMSHSMRIYLQTHKLQSAETDDWRQAVEQATGQDWMPFFNQWYFRGGHPSLRVRYAFDDPARMLRMTIRQTTSPDSSFLYDLQLKAAVVYAGKPAQMIPLHLNRRSQQFSFPADAQGKYPVVLVDAEHVLPGSIDEEKPMQMWMGQLKASGDFIGKLMAVNAALRQDGQTLSPSLLAEALRDTMENIRIYTLRSLKNLKRQSTRDVLLPQIKYAVQTSGHNKERAAAFDVLSAWKCTDEMPALIAAVSDSSYLVAGSALAALTQLAPDTAYRLGLEALAQHPKTFLEAAAWEAVARKGAPQDFELLSQDLNRVYGGEKIALAATIATYAKATTDEQAFQKCLSLITDMAGSDAISKYRLSMGANLFQLAQYYQEAHKGARMQLALKYADQLVQAEPDEDNRAAYREMKAQL